MQNKVFHLLTQRVALGCEARALLPEMASLLSSSWPCFLLLGEGIPGCCATSPNLLPDPPWPGRSFTHSPSSSSPEAGAGFSLQPGDGGGGRAAGTQASHFPSRPFLLEALPLPPRSCGLPSIHIVFPRCFLCSPRLWFAGGLGPGAGKGLRFASLSPPPCLASLPSSSLSPYLLWQQEDASSVLLVG